MVVSLSVGNRALSVNTRVWQTARMALIAAVILSTSGDIADSCTQDWFHLCTQKHTSCIVDAVYVVFSEMVMLLFVIPFV